MTVFKDINGNDLEVTVDNERMNIRTPAEGVILDYQTVLRFAPAWKDMVAAIHDNIVTNKKARRETIVTQIEDLKAQLAEIDNL